LSRRVLQKEEGPAPPEVDANEGTTGPRKRAFEGVFVTDSFDIVFERRKKHTESTYSEESRNPNTVDQHLDQKTKGNKIWVKRGGSECLLGGVEAGVKLTRGRCAREIAAVLKNNQKTPHTI